MSSTSTSGACGARSTSASASRRSRRSAARATASARAGHSGMPVKLRLTLVFALAIAVVLVAAGLFVYLRFRAELNRSIDASLHSRATEVGSLAKGLPKTGGVRSLGGLGETIAQVLDSRGRLVAGTRGSVARPLVGRSALPPPDSPPGFVDRQVARDEGPTRLIIERIPGT